MPLSTITPRVDTELHLMVKDAEGKAVSIAKAELILVEHRHVGRLELDTSDDRFTLMLDEVWLRSRWNDSTFQVADDDIPVGPFESMECVYLYIQADGYAPLQSDPFLWIGASGGGRQEHGIDGVPGRVSQARIGFLNNSSIVLSEGKQNGLALTMRKPQTRYLRFVDDDGNPVQGVYVASHVFWGLIGHCGWTGGDLLAESVSDGQGRARVPDGDLEYAFHFEKPGHVCKKCDAEFFPMRLITHLEAEETIVDLHRWQRWPIRILATREEEPAANETLFGLYVACPCFTCSRRLGRTDSDGMIVLSNFYPEEWKTIFFADSSGNRVWQRDLRLSQPTGIIHAELPLITPTTEEN